MATSRTEPSSHTTTGVTKDDLDRLKFNLSTKENIQNSLMNNIAILSTLSNPTESLRLIIKKIELLKNKTTLMIETFKSKLNKLEMETINDIQKAYIKAGTEGIASLFILQLDVSTKIMPFLSEKKSSYIDYAVFFEIFFETLALETEDILIFLLPNTIKTKLIQEKIIDEKILTDLSAHRETFTQSMKQHQFTIDKTNKNKPAILIKLDKMISENIDKMTNTSEAIRQATEILIENIQTIENLKNSLNKKTPENSGSETKIPNSTETSTLENLSKIKDKLSSMITQYHQLIKSLECIKFSDLISQFAESAGKPISNLSDKTTWDLLIDKQRKIAEIMITTELSNLKNNYIFLFDSANALLVLFIKIFKVKGIDSSELEILYPEISEIIKIFESSTFKLSKNTNGSIFSNTGNTTTKKDIFFTVSSEKKESVTSSKEDFKNAFDLFCGNEIKVEIWEKFLLAHQDKELADKPSGKKPVGKKKPNKNKTSDPLKKTPELSDDQPETRYVFNTSPTDTQNINISPGQLKLKAFITLMDRFNTQIIQDLKGMEKLSLREGIIGKKHLEKANKIVSRFNIYQKTINESLEEPISENSKEKIWTVFKSNDGYTNTLAKVFFKKYNELQKNIPKWENKYQILKEKISESKAMRLYDRKTTPWVAEKNIKNDTSSSTPNKTTAEFETEFLNLQINISRLSELSQSNWFVRQQFINDDRKVSLPSPVIDTLTLIEETSRSLKSEKNKTVLTRFVGSTLKDLLLNTNTATDCDFHIQAGYPGELISALSQVCGSTNNGFDCTISNKPGREKLVVLTHKKTNQKIDLWISEESTQPLFTIHEIWADIKGNVNANEQAKSDLIDNILRPSQNSQLQKKLIQKPELIFFTMKYLLKNPMMVLSEDLVEIIDTIQITEQTCEQHKDIIKVKIDELSKQFGDAFLNLFIKLNLPQKIFNVEINETVALTRYLTSFFTSEPKIKTETSSTASKNGMFGTKATDDAIKKTLVENQSYITTPGQ